MARRRMISEKQIFDVDYNSMSLEAQWLFDRMLRKTCDYGLVPGDMDTLCNLLNIKQEYRDRMESWLNEIKNHKFLIEINLRNHVFLSFNPNSFDKYNIFLVKRRTKSEYTGYIDAIYDQYRDNIEDILKEYTKDKDLIYYIKDKRYKIKDKREGNGETLFSESEYFDFEKFKIKMSNGYKKYDLVYYYEAVKTWGENKQVTRKDWIATARNFIAKDLKAGTEKLKRISEFNKPSSNDTDSDRHL